MEGERYIIDKNLNRVFKVKLDTNETRSVLITGVKVSYSEEIIREIIGARSLVTFEVFYWYTEKAIYA